MVDLGARNLLLLSRSGAMSHAALEMLDEMQEKGVRINAPRCDISDEQAVVVALRQSEENMPPIKGCIQGSMVLKVCLFFNWRGLLTVRTGGNP